MLCGLVLAADTVLLGAFTPLVPHYSERFDLSSAETGLVVAAFPAGAAFAALPAGRLAGVIGAKATLLIGLSLLSVASAWFAVLSSPAELALTRAFQGVGSTVAWIGTFSWLVAREPPDRRGELIGRAYSMAMLGSLIGPSLAVAVIAAGALPTFASVAAGFGALLVAFAWIPGLATPPPSTSARQRSLLRNRGVMIGTLLLGLQSLVFGSLSVLAPLRLSDLGFSTSMISAVYVSTGILVIAINPLAGRWSDRRGHRLPMVYLLTAGAVAVSVLAYVNSAWAFAGVLITTEVALFGLSAPASALVTDAVEAASLSLGVAWAVILLAWAPPNMVGALLGGVLRDAAHAPYLLLGALSILTVALLMRRDVRAALR